MMACWRLTVGLKFRQTLFSGVRPMVALYMMGTSKAGACAGMTLILADMKTG